MNNALGNLRHLHEHLVKKSFIDSKALADGLLAPAIRHIEEMAASRDGIARIIDPKAHKAFDEDRKRTKGVTLEKPNLINRITDSQEKADDILVLLGLIKKIDYEAVAKSLYMHYTDNHPTIHCNRFPSWEELDEKSKQPWIEEARKVTNV